MRHRTASSERLASARDARCRFEEVCHACQVVPDEAGAEAEEDVAMPRNNTERDVQLNLAVALRMVEERG